MQEKHLIPGFKKNSLQNPTATSSSVPNRSLQNQPNFSPQEYHQEALQLANKLGRKDVIECDRILNQSQLPQQLSGGSSSMSASQTPNLLKQVRPSTQLVLVDEAARTDIGENDVVLSPPGGGGYYKLVPYKDADTQYPVYRFVENFDSTKHFKVRNLHSLSSKSLPNLDDIVLVEINNMNQTLGNINQQQQQISDIPNRIIIYKNPIQDGFFVGLQSGNYIVDGLSSLSSSSNTRIQIDRGGTYYTLLPYTKVLANSKKFSLVTFITIFTQISL